MRAKSPDSGSAGPRQRQVKCRSDLPSPELHPLISSRNATLSPKKKPTYLRKLLVHLRGGHSPAESRRSSRGSSRRHGCNTSGHLEQQPSKMHPAPALVAAGPLFTFVMRGRRDSKAAALTQGFCRRDDIRQADTRLAVQAARAGRGLWTAARQLCDDPTQVRGENNPPPFAAVTTLALHSWWQQQGSKETPRSSLLSVCECRAAVQGAKPQSLNHGRRALAEARHPEGLERAEK